jgi:DtxR family Mn-dependent transcriptional regulator
VVHREFLEQPADEVLEQIWCRREDGDETLSGLLLHSREPGAGAILDRLAAAGLVTLGGDRIDLSEAGRVRARQLVRRNRLAERLLADVLEVPESESERTACLMEHVLSPAVTDAVCAFLGHPPTCPHGKAIPPGPCCGQRKKRMIQPLVMRLTDMEPGSQGRIVLIAPKVTSRLDRLGSFGVAPGSVLTLRQKRPSMVVEIGATTLAMEDDVAEDIFVRRE